MFLLAAAVGLTLAPLPRQPAPEPSIGDPAALSAAYARWSVREDRAGRGHLLVLPLGYVKGLSVRPSEAKGRLTLDLRDGTVAVEVSDPGPPRALDVWLVDNWSGSGRSARPEPGDAALRLGRLAEAGDRLRLNATLDPADIQGFEIDLAVVAEAGMHPEEAGVLFGSPTLFQKLRATGRGEVPSESPGALAMPFSLLVPAAQAKGKGGGRSFAALVEQGEALFMNETFEGNGRTCATCHPPQNNFTIDPEFIATLPNDDPLFVAEFNPDLAENFENDKLLRELALLLENVDGFDDLENKFVMRGVPHTLALPLSMDDDDPEAFPLQRLGWSGDGAAGSGTLREFPIGAITQHFTRTLRREPGLDFRLPTDDELDAMEAFQMSLGRQHELDFSTLLLADPAAAKGQRLFVDAGSCDLCHRNAGANAAFGNGINENFDIGVEQLVKGSPKTRPVDGGFGTEIADNGSFGDGTFNTPSLVEAADTPPFFHNNAIETLEEAVAFYSTDIFNDSPAGRLVRQVNEDGIALDADEINEIGAFLRVINALENIRSASDLMLRAKRLAGEAGSQILDLAKADVDDAIEVLEEAMDGEGLHSQDAMPHFRAAASLLLEASATDRDRSRRFLIEEALDELEAARNYMIVEIT